MVMQRVAYNNIILGIVGAEVIIVGGLLYSSNSPIRGMPTIFVQWCLR